MVSDLSFIFQDTSSTIAYGIGDWKVNNNSWWSGGSTVYPASAVVDGHASRIYASFNATFHGTSISFFGNSDTEGSAYNLDVMIDDISYTFAYDPNDGSYSQLYGQWYQSPVLSDGPHQITVGHMSEISVDFAIVTTGEIRHYDNSSKAIVDGDDPSIVYRGDWQRSKQKFATASLGRGIVPFRNSTHQSHTPGDTATFNFTGTSVSVYGVFNYEKLGSLSATYALDGSPTSKTYTVSPTTPGFLAGEGQQPNFQLFSTDSLEATNHVLVINVTDCTNMTFILDYITYTPLYPVLDVETTSPNTTSTATVSNPSETLSAPPEGKSTNTEQSKVPTGAIIGGVVGGTFFLSIVAALIWQRRQLAKQNKRQHRFAVTLFNSQTTFNSNASLPQMVEHSLGDGPRITPFTGAPTDNPDDPEILELNRTLSLTASGGGPKLLAGPGPSEPPNATSTPRRSETSIAGGSKTRRKPVSQLPESSDAGSRSPNLFSRDAPPKYSVDSSATI